MISDFIVVVAGVPVSTDGEDLGFADVFCSSVQPYVAKGLLAEGMDLCADPGEDTE